MEFALVKHRRFELRHDVVRESVALERVADHVRLEFAAAVLVVKKRDGVVAGRNSTAEDAVAAGILDRRRGGLPYVRVVTRKACGTVPQRTSKEPVVVAKACNLNRDTCRRCTLCQRRRGPRGR